MPHVTACPFSLLSLMWKRSMIFNQRTIVHGFRRSHSSSVPSANLRSIDSHPRSSRASVGSYLNRTACFGLIPYGSRVHAHAAAALINFCEGAERDTLLPYLDPIVERLLKLLNPVQDGGRPTKRYVQEQAVTTLAMVADASETTFAKVRVHFSNESETGDEEGNHNSTIHRSCRSCSTC
jgi:hypothetical protein